MIVGERATAGFLIVGSLLFLVGAVLPPEPTKVFSSPRPVYLEILHRHRRRWALMNTLMIAGVIGTGIGLVLLAGVLRSGGDAWRSTAGATLYVVTSVLWLAALTFRMSAASVVARDAAAGQPEPTWFEAFESWTGLMYRTYMIGAYLALIAVGAGVRCAHIPGDGYGWFVMAFGVVLLASFLTRLPRTSFGAIAEMPLLPHVATLVLGLALL